MNDTDFRASVVSHNFTLKIQYGFTNFIFIQIFAKIDVQEQPSFYRSARAVFVFEHKNCSFSSQLHAVDRPSGLTITIIEFLLYQCT